MCEQLMAGNKQFVLCKKFVLLKSVLYQRFHCITISQNNISDVHAAQVRSKDVCNTLVLL